MSRLVKSVEQPCQDLHSRLRPPDDALVEAPRYGATRAPNAFEATLTG